MAKQEVGAVRPGEARFLSPRYMMPMRTPPSSALRSTRCSAWPTPKRGHVSTPACVWVSLERQWRRPLGRAAGSHVTDTPLGPLGHKAIALSSLTSDSFRETRPPRHGSSWVLQASAHSLSVACEVGPFARAYPAKVDCDAGVWRASGRQGSALAAGRSGRCASVDGWTWAAYACPCGRRWQRTAGVACARAEDVQPRRSSGSFWMPTEYKQR